MTNIYRLALQVQDASNPSGVINSLANEVLPAIRQEPGYVEHGTQYLASHPVMLLFLDKLVSLTHLGYISDHDMAISKAYDRCHELAEGLEAVESASLPGGPLDPEIRERDRILAQRQADRQAQS